ncbi:phytoene desaturase family protein [Rossellomorea aquimaris]|uniref:phytoene desaturase family protein n=1 Tax=Rossellomorea aquimaris TaxID=189382 RepID=UPI0007D093E8|nr:FAD-dependent oxidoreductase [Rossellomorea aquimaris]
MTQDRWDVVIVGGGLAGYVSANILGKAGLKTLLVEKANKVGGRAKTDIVNNQYLNIGPHALYKKGRASSILTDLGITITGNAPKKNSIIIYHDTPYIAPFSPKGLVQSKFLSWNEKIEWIGILRKVQKLQSGLFSHKTFQQFVEETTNSFKIQQLLYTLGRLASYSHAPEKISASVMLTHIQLGMGGVVYVDGGWQSIIDQLHNQAVTNSVQIQTGSSVKHLNAIESGEWQLKLSNQETILSKFIIYTGSPQALNGLLGVPSKKLPFNQLEPIKAATLDVALTKLPNPNNLFALGIDEPYYFSVHSNYARLSHDGKSKVLHVLRYHHPNAHINGPDEKLKLEGFLETLQPGWKNYEIKSRCFPQITVNCRLSKVGDETIFSRGLSIAPGLYMAGDWASPYVMLSEAAVESGKQAALEVIDKETGV